VFDQLKKALAAFFLPGGQPDTVAVARTVYAPDGKRRVRFFCREEDGICGYREEYFDDKLLEMNWLPVKEGTAEKYPDLDSATAAALAELPWLHLVLH